MGAEEMKKCIVVKGIQFRHQFVFDGPGDGRHCVFCQCKEEPSIINEDYPGQAYFHANNQNIKNAEAAYKARSHAHNT